MATPVGDDRAPARFLTRSAPRLNKGYPPSMRQIGDMVGLASLSSVTHQLGRLETMGYIRRDPAPRAIEVLDENGVGIHGNPPRPYPSCRTSVGDETVPVPWLDELQRAVPSPPSSPWRMCLPCPASWSVTASCSCSRPDSMIDAAICDGDWVVVREQHRQRRYCCCSARRRRQP